DLESIADGGVEAKEESGAGLKGLVGPAADKDRPARKPEEAEVDLGEAAVVDSGVVPPPAKEGAEAEAPAEPKGKKKKKKGDESDEEVAAAEKDKKKKAESGEVETVPPKKRGRFGAFVLGGFLMAMAAALGYVVVWVLGLEPPGEWRDAARETVG